MQLRAKISSTVSQQYISYKGETLRNVITLPISAEKWWQVSMVKLKSLLSVYFVARLINHLLTVTIDGSYSTWKVVTKSFDINQKMATIQDNKYL